ncbi:MAG: hypothetical protein KatS3mg034_1673 [Vicingaceae bacterium]|nr:MAG: hypothetical protein KatS3mg034_1673 [Vicingaceae bacterium]
MKKTALFIIFAVIVLNPCFVLGQDFHFSNPKALSLSLNPALAGTGHSTMHAAAAYRTQWQSVTMPYITYAGNFDMSFLKDPNSPRQNAFFGVGFDFYSDRAGDANLGLTQFNVSISGTVPFDDNNRLSAGLQGGIGQRKADFSRLFFANQYDGKGFDPNVNSGEFDNLSGPAYADVAFGMVYQYSTAMNRFWENNRTDFQFGIAFYHITQPQITLLQNGNDKLYRKVSVFASYYRDIANTKLAIMPSLYYYLQGPHRELLMNFFLRNKIKESSSKVNGYNEISLYFGLSFRYQDALIPSFGFSVGDLWFNISYDVNISSLAQASRYSGGLEFTLQYNNLSRALRKAR